MGLTVRDLIKALADLDPTDEVVFVPSHRGLFGTQAAVTPRIPIVDVHSVQRVVAGKSRKVENFAALIGKSNVQTR